MDKYEIECFIDAIDHKFKHLTCSFMDDPDVDDNSKHISHQKMYLFNRVNLKIEELLKRGVAIEDIHNPIISIKKGKFKAKYQYANPKCYDTCGMITDFNRCLKSKVKLQLHISKYKFTKNDIEYAGVLITILRLQLTL